MSLTSHHVQGPFTGVLDEGQFLFIDFFCNVQYKMEIKIHSNYDTAPSASSRHCLLKMSLCCTKFITERHGDNYSMVIVNSRCRMSFFFSGSATPSDDKWLCPEFHFSQKIFRLPFLHYYKDANVSKSNAHNTALQMPARKRRSREGKLCLRRLCRGPLGRTLCRNCLLTRIALQKDL